MTTESILLFLISFTITSFLMVTLQNRYYAKGALLEFYMTKTEHMRNLSAYVCIFALPFMAGAVGTLLGQLFGIREQLIVTSTLPVMLSMFVNISAVFFAPVHFKGMFKDKATVARIYYLVFVGIYGLMAFSGGNFGAGVLYLQFREGKGLIFFLGVLTPMVLAVLTYFLTARSYRQLKQRTFPRHDNEFRWHKEAIDQQTDDVMLLEISRLFKDTIYEAYSQLKEGLESGMAVSRSEQLQLVDGALHMRAEDLTNLVMLAQQNGDIRKIKQGLDRQSFDDRPVRMVSPVPGPYRQPYMRPYGYSSGPSYGYLGYGYMSGYGYNYGYSSGIHLSCPDHPGCFWCNPYGGYKRPGYGHGWWYDPCGSHRYNGLGRWYVGGDYFEAYGWWYPDGYLRQGYGHGFWYDPCGSRHENGPGMFVQDGHKDAQVGFGWWYNRPFNHGYRYGYDYGRGYGYGGYR